MKRLISEFDCESYSHLYSLLKELNIPGEYKWLVTDLEAHSFADSTLDSFLSKNCECFIMTHSKLMGILEKEDIQWIWGVFSLFDSSMNEKDILVEELPGIGDMHPKPHLFDNNKPCIQHPKAILELDAFDSSFLAITSIRDEDIETFKRLYPSSTPNFLILSDDIDDLVYCPMCGERMIGTWNPPSLTWDCPKCDYALTTTKFEPIDLDDATYSIILSEDNRDDRNVLKALSRFTGLNYLQVKQLLQNPTEILKGKSRDIKNKKSVLDEAEIKYRIEPDFPY